MRKVFSAKEIVLGVTGSVAAYKACEIASRLFEFGAYVTPVLTHAATHFVGPASFEAITGRRAITELFEPLQNPEIEHVAMANRAHLFIIAPATANMLGKAAHGIADDWLTTTLLATRAPILFAPAMNSNMYDHPATQANIATLRQRGCFFVGPAAGRLACGSVGIGRMIDPLIVIEAAAPLLSARKDLAGKRVLITSGANHEPIDPIRFIGNRSSGKMGRALAFEALIRGAQVTVVTGPAQVPLPYGAEVITVQTAREMANEAVPRAREADIVLAAAAVADYRVENPSSQKQKRTGAPLTLRLVENPDILAEIAANRQENQVIVGFAAETHDMVGHARAKLEAKKLDLIVANQVGAPGSDFGTDTVTACLIGRDGRLEEFSALPKDELAEGIFDRITALLP